MLKFSIKGLLLFTTFVALCLALLYSRLQFAELKSEFETQRAKFHFLNVSDVENIAAVEMPRYTGQLWQWRVHLPAERQFRLRAAYNDLKPMRVPRDAKPGLSFSLESGESIVSASLEKVEDQWKLRVRRQSEDDQESGNSEVIRCESTKWLDEGDYGWMTVGEDGTFEAEPMKPFILLQIRDSTPQSNGKQLPWNTPTQGVLVWIEASPDE